MKIRLRSQKIAILSLALIVTQTNAPAVAQSGALSDEPDLALEAKLHNIYEKFGATPLTKEDWATIAKDKMQESYQIQSGDTLWGISSTLFGSGDFWPKVWQLNDSITNPHEIRPGNALAFSFGNIADAPKVEVAQGAETPEKEEAVEEAPEEPGPKVINEKKLFRPKRTSQVLLEIPPSLGEWQRNRGNYDSEGFQVDHKGRIPPATGPVMYHFLPTAPEGEGEIVETEMGGEVASNFQYVFVKLKQGGVGDRLVVFSAQEPIENEDDKVIGYPVLYSGELKIVETVSSKNSIYKAIVEKTIHPIRVGSFVTKGSLQVAEFSKSGPMGQTVAHVVGGEFDENRRQLSTSAYVYLDAGSAEGLQQGMILNVLRSQKSRNPETLVENLAMSIATIKVVHTAEHLATAIVVEGKDPILPGDYTGVETTLGIDAGGPESTADVSKVAAPAPEEELAPAPQANPEPAIQEPTVEPSSNPEDLDKLLE